jgi:hypothetical protein
MPRLLPNMLPNVPPACEGMGSEERVKVWQRASGESELCQLCVGAASCVPSVCQLSTVHSCTRSPPASAAPLSRSGKAPPRHPSGQSPPTGGGRAVGAATRKGGGGEPRADDHDGAGAGPAGDA